MTDARARASLRGALVIAGSSVFFGLMAVLVRTVAASVPWAQVVTVRHAIGSLGIALYFVGAQRRPTLSRPGPLVLRGVFGGLAVLCYFFAIHALGPAPATVLNYTSPVYAAVWAVVFLKERPSPYAWLGLVVATVGAALVTVATGAHAGPQWLLGAVAGISSGVFGGAAMTAVKAARQDADAATVFLAFSVVGLGMALPFAATSWVALDAELLWRLAAIGSLALVAQLLFTWGMGHTTATLGSATTQLVPAFAWLFSSLLLDEPFTGLSVVGALLCVAGVVVGVLRPTASTTEL